MKQSQVVARLRATVSNRRIIVFPFISAFFDSYFETIHLSCFFSRLVPVRRVRLIVNKDTTRGFRDSGSFNLDHGHDDPCLSLRGARSYESRKNSTETPAVQFVRGSRFVIGFKSRTAVSICGWYQLL